VSVAGANEKGKSELMKDSWRPLRQRLSVLMAFEIPHQHYEEQNDHEHKNAEVVAGGIGTASRGH
jgi:hypothetical protein